jgi:hypothetical protein
MGGIHEATFPIVDIDRAAYRIVAVGAIFA